MIDQLSFLLGCLCIKFILFFLIYIVENRIKTCLGCPKSFKFKGAHIGYCKMNNLIFSENNFFCNVNDVEINGFNGFLLTSAFKCKVIVFNKMTYSIIDRWNSSQMKLFERYSVIECLHSAIVSKSLCMQHYILSWSLESGSLLII